MHREDHVGEEKSDIWQPRNGASEETNPADTLISTSALQNAQEINLCCSNHYLWYIVVAAPANSWTTETQGGRNMTGLFTNDYSENFFLQNFLGDLSILTLRNQEGFLGWWAGPRVTALPLAAECIKPHKTETQLGLLLHRLVGVSSKTKTQKKIKSARPQSCSWYPEWSDLCILSHCHLRGSCVLTYSLLCSVFHIKGAGILLALPFFFGPWVSGVLVGASVETGRPGLKGSGVSFRGVTTVDAVKDLRKAWPLGWSCCLLRGKA
jgi:hypothetical protein